jgi:hypothetical protein
MDLARQKRILGDVRSTGIFVEGKEKQPDHSCDYAKKRKYIRQAYEEKLRIAPQSADHGCHPVTVSLGLSGAASDDIIG